MENQTLKNSLYKRMRYSYVIIFIIILFALFITHDDWQFLYTNQVETIEIAFVAPLNTHNGQSMLNAVNMAVEQMNATGGIQGRKIKLLTYDDDNDPEQAKTHAQAIKETNALAVIGHLQSNVSIAAGEIYKQQHIPAISPTSTSVAVTHNNPWYFCTTFNDDFQGQFLAYYTRYVFNQQQTLFIYEDSVYGNGLMQAFSRTANNIGLGVAQTWAINDAELQQEQLDKLVNAIKQQDGIRILVLGVDSHHVAKLVHRLKEEHIERVLLVSNGVSFSDVEKALENNPLRQHSIDHYLDGMYNVQPMLEDSASQPMYNFYQRYRQRYSMKPDWDIFNSYDAINLIAHALKNTTLTDNTLENRENLRNTIINISSSKNSFKGITGEIFFDQEGDCIKPLSVGFFYQNHIISADSQLQTLTNLKGVLQPEAAIATQRLIKADDNLYFYRTNVVFTGIKINQISDINQKEHTADLDFNLWFRHSEHVKEVEDVIFLNAVEPIQLGTPEKVDSTTSQYTQVKINYALYHVRGKFRIDFVPSAYQQHVVGVQFRHENAMRRDLIYITDLLGMNGMSNLLEQMEQHHVLVDRYHWQMTDIQFYQNAIYDNTLGSIKHILAHNDLIEYSRFNVALFLAPKVFFELSDFVSIEQAKNLFYVLIILLAFSIYIYLRICHSCAARTPIFFISIIVLGILGFGQFIVVDALVPYLDKEQLKYIDLLFETLWWIVPTILIVLILEHIFWQPLEIRLKRKIPNILRSSLASFIYLLTFFGIIAFVYDRPLTSLLATSGVIAMIIGLAIQMDISNIFSGIVINLERPFNVGDWIKIKDLDEGRVVDITWRTTRIHLRNQSIVSIPNSQAAETQVINYNMPTSVYMISLPLFISPQYDPVQINQLLLTATQVDGVLAKPPARVAFRGINEWAAQYMIILFADDYSKRLIIQERVWLAAWKILQQHDIILLHKNIDVSSQSQVVLRQGNRAIKNKETIFNMLKNYTKPTRKS